LRVARESLPVWVLVALIAAWWAAVAILKVPAFLLPPPQDVLPRIWESRQSLTGHSLVASVIDAPINARQLSSP
jgi:ABC-type nitrate/sulfonate/bicarbonate transport system permease component